MSIPSYRIFYEYILESACRSASVAACLSLSPSHCYQHARNPQYLFGTDFQSKCNACEQKTPCGHSQPRRLRGLRLSMAWAAFASAPVAPSRLLPFGKKSRQLPRDGRLVPAGRPRDLADAFVLPGEQRHALALLNAKMAAMGHGFLLRCMSSQAPSQDCRGSFHVLGRRCTRSENPPAIARESAYQKKLQNAQEYIEVHVSICKLAKTISYRSSREKRITR